MRTIILYQLSQADVTVFNSLLPILSSKSGQHWKTANRGEGDITIVDADTAVGETQARKLEAQGKSVIRMKVRNDANGKDQYCLQKPLRSADILACINLIGETFTARSVKSSEAKQPKARYQLRRWPNKEIIRACPGSSRLLAILMRQSLTIAEAAKLANMSAVDVSHFIRKCQQHRFIEMTSAAKPPANSPVDRQPTKHAKLFFKLRNKLMSRATTA